MENKEQSVIQAIDRHLNTMDEKELVMVLRFIHSLKDFQ